MGHGPAPVFGITPAQTISFVPMMILAIIFGLSSDYEVFVVSRMRRSTPGTATPPRAVRPTALSGRMVTAAALIMFSIFVAFMFTSDPTIKAIGFSSPPACSFDAFVVRLTLGNCRPSWRSSVRRMIHPRWFARHVPDPDIEGERLEHRLIEES